MNKIFCNKMVMNDHIFPINLNSNLFFVLFEIYNVFIISVVEDADFTLLLISIIGKPGKPGKGIWSSTCC